MEPQDHVAALLEESKVRPAKSPTRAELLGILPEVTSDEDLEFEF